MAIDKGLYPQTWLKLQGAEATGRGWKHPERNEILKCEKGADEKYPDLTGEVVEVPPVEPEPETSPVEPEPETPPVEPEPEPETPPDEPTEP